MTEDWKMQKAAEIVAEAGRKAKPKEWIALQALSIGEQHGLDEQIICQTLNADEIVEDRVKQRIEKARQEGIEEGKIFNREHEIYIHNLQNEITKLRDGIEKARQEEREKHEHDEHMCQGCLDIFECGYHEGYNQAKKDILEKIGKLHQLRKKNKAMLYDMVSFDDLEAWLKKELGQQAGSIREE